MNQLSQQQDETTNGGLAGTTPQALLGATIITPPSPPLPPPPSEPAFDKEGNEDEDEDEGGGGGIEENGEEHDQWDQFRFYEKKLIIYRSSLLVCNVATANGTAGTAASAGQGSSQQPLTVRLYQHQASFRALNTVGLTVWKSVHKAHIFLFLVQFTLFGKLFNNHIHTGSRVWLWHAIWKTCGGVRELLVWPTNASSSWVVDVA